MVSLPLCETMIGRDAFGLSGPETGFQNMCVCVKQYEGTETSETNVYASFMVEGESGPPKW